MPALSSAPLLRVLHLEDSEFDHELMKAHLQRGGLNVEIGRASCRERVYSSV